MSVGDTAVSERMIQREHSLIRKKVSMWFSFCLYFKKSQLMFYDSGPSCVHACVRARVYVLCNNPPEHIWASIWNETMLPAVLWHPFFLECPLMSNQGSQETAGGPPQCRPVDTDPAACSLEGGPALSLQCPLVFRGSHSCFLRVWRNPPLESSLRWRFPDTQKSMVLFGLCILLFLQNSSISQGSAATSCLLRSFRFPLPLCISQALLKPASADPVLAQHPPLVLLRLLP